MFSEKEAFMSHKKYRNIIFLLCFVLSIFLVVQTIRLKKEKILVEKLTIEKNVWKGRTTREAMKLPSLPEK